MNKLFAQVVAPVARQSAERALTRVFIRDLVLDAQIGAYDHEREKPQRIRVNLDLQVELRPGPSRDQLADVVSYDTMIAAAKEIVGAGHVNLCETLAERIAERLLIDRRVKVATVRVEKLDVFAEAASIGVEIERKQV
ncbi:dihydroneopterin aldolase [Skermanella stibiiresistens SB22]|uniref:7,8-dihydroneopterin aldolase n=1 Tax=Skermanella stibiiresistens SB22 TaxID=1385369 RepID=W9GZY5_9PROT|nr:dihydroneopterin aldolase [Skermanella stibiiresistens]EWY38027.1 dihydroneopterin aldolase [Skermanella stibiiresistens SB22]